MGANMVRRLIKGGHQCVVFNRSPQAVADLVRAKAVGASSLADLARSWDAWGLEVTAMAEAAE
jgi:6-phosphogluconate dehydrogenase